MRRLWIAAVVLAAACAAEPKPTWAGGADFKTESPAAVADIVAHGETYRDRQVQIEGTVTRVCQGRGCWVEVADQDANVIAKSLDHTVLFPKDCAGKKVRVLGTVRIDPADKCEADHSGKPDHECPKPSLLIEISGAKLY